MENTNSLTTEKNEEIFNSSANGNLNEYYTPVGTQGRKGHKAPRMNLAIPQDIYDYIRRESRKEGMTYSEFICAVMRQRQTIEKKEI